MVLTMILSYAKIITINLVFGSGEPSARNN